MSLQHLQLDFFINLTIMNKTNEKVITTSDVCRAYELETNLTNLSKCKAESKDTT